MSVKKLQQMMLLLSGCCSSTNAAAHGCLSASWPMRPQPAPLHGLVSALQTSEVLSAASLHALVSMLQFTFGADCPSPVPLYMHF